MIEVIAVDTANIKYVAETLSASEFAMEGAAGCATIARNFCRDNGYGFSNWTTRHAKNWITKDNFQAVQNIGYN